MVGGETTAEGERYRRVFAHLSVFVNLVTGFLGTAAALALWWTHRKRSPGVARHALRAFWHQVAWALLVAPVGFLCTLTFVLLLPGPEAQLSTLLLVVALVWVAMPFAEAAWAAYRAGLGEDYRYLVDRLTSVGGGKARARKRKARPGHFDGDLDDGDGSYSWEDLSDDVGDFGDGGDSGGGDFGGGGDSGSW